MIYSGLPKTRRILVDYCQMQDTITDQQTQMPHKWMALGCSQVIRRWDGQMLFAKQSWDLSLAINQKPQVIFAAVPADSSALSQPLSKQDWFDHFWFQPWTPRLMNRPGKPSIGGITIHSTFPNRWREAIVTSKTSRLSSLKVTILQDWLWDNPCRTTTGN